MIFKAPKEVTVGELCKLMKYDEVDIILDKRHQRIWLEGKSGYGNEKVTKMLRRYDERYNNGG